ncbi:uncharacterized protein DMENIID0001_139850 [Sergentomyia squamirostris]
MSLSAEEFDTVAFEKNLQNLKDTQDSISSMSTWCLQWRSHHKKIVSSWLTVLKQAKIEQRLTLFYLANDVIQYSKRNNYEFVESWGTTLQRATTMVRDEKVKGKITRIFTIWEQREIYNEDFISDLVGLLNMPPPSKRNKELEAEDPQTTALIGNIRDCVKLQERTDKSFKNLTKMPQCDLENIKANLKDRSHVEDVEKELEDGLTRLESYMSTLKAEIKARGILIAALVQADEFYHTQRGDVKTVAIAYRNFGNRIKTMKKKLEELTPTLPSPMPSPDINAPSPEPDIEFDLPVAGANYSNGFMSSYMGGGALPFDINDFHRDSHTSRLDMMMEDQGSRSSVGHHHIQVLDSRNSSQSETDFNVNDIFKNISSHQGPPQPVPPVSRPSYGGGAYDPSQGSSDGSQAAYNPALDIEDFVAETEYVSGYGGDSGQNYASPAIVPPPVPPPNLQNSMNSYNSSWGSDALEWLTDNPGNYDPNLQTPSSPPHFEQKPPNETGIIEYIEETEISSAGDIDHRQLPLPSALIPLPSKAKSRAVDVDHRNLISLTGSPGQQKALDEKDTSIPPPPVVPPPLDPSLSWPPVVAGKDIDLRQSIVLPPGNPGERLSPNTTGGKDDNALHQSPVIPLEPPPSFDTFFNEKNPPPPLPPNFDKPPPGFVVPAIPPLMSRRLLKSPSSRNQQQNGPDNIESVDMEMSDEDPEEYHNMHQDDEGNGDEMGGEDEQQDEEEDGDREKDMLRGNRDYGPRGMGMLPPPQPMMNFLPNMSFSPGLLRPPMQKMSPGLLPTPGGGPRNSGNWNGPPPGGNFTRGGFFGGDRMRSPGPFPPIQPLFNFRPGMNIRGGGGLRPPRGAGGGRMQPYRGNRGGGNRGGRGGKW